METVTLTELNQRAGDAVTRAGAGEILIITIHGIPVALLVPLPPDFDRRAFRDKQATLAKEEQKGE